MPMVLPIMHGVGASQDQPLQQMNHLDQPPICLQIGDLVATMVALQKKKGITSQSYRFRIAVD